MKKITFLSFLFFCFNIFITLNALAKTTLSYANFFPPTHIQSQLAESWCAEVVKRTNGEVSIKYFPGQTLVKAPQTYDAVVNGISHVGMTVLAYSPGRFPISSAIDLPMGYKSGVQATAIANAVLSKFQPQEFDDTQIMYLHAHGPGLINMGSKRVAIMEDMKGLKIIASGAKGLLISILGGSPIAIGMDNAYAALQKGVVDGSLHPLEANKGWKLGEVVKYVTESYSVAYTTTFAIFMNKDKWSELSPEVQKTIHDINLEWSAKHGEAWDADDKAGADFFKEKGGEFISMTDEEAARWKDAMTPVFEDYYKNVEPKGVDGKAVVEFIISAVSGGVILDDSDHDGISDDMDRCSDTPVGDFVDLFGCTIIKGDINRDGIIDLKDSQLGLKVITSKQASVDSAAECDEDGKVGLKDTIFIIQQSGKN